MDKPPINREHPDYAAGWNDYTCGGVSFAFGVVGRDRRTYQAGWNDAKDNECEEHWNNLCRTIAHAARCTIARNRPPSFF